MPKIAISYRRTDSSAIAGRIADRLAAKYGKESIFIDVDNVPFGTDFRKYIQEVWSEITVLIVVVGPKWLGAGEGAATDRIHERRDVVRIEVEMALKRDVPIIPILIDGATMPTRGQLPKSLRTFSDRNAAEVDDGRDFHPHMDRLIRAIDRITGQDFDRPTHGLGATRLESVEERTQVGEASPAVKKQLTGWLLSLWDVAFPVFTLVVLHHLIVNVFDLDTIYLRIVSFVVPFLFGVLIFWHLQREPFSAFATAASIGLISVATMSASQGLNSGRPIKPSTALEWRESIEYLVSITFSFFVGYLVARSLIIWQWKKRDSASFLSVIRGRRRDSE